MKVTVFFYCLQNTINVRSHGLKSLLNLLCLCWFLMVDGFLSSGIADQKRPDGIWTWSRKSQWTPSWISVPTIQGQLFRGSGRNRKNTTHYGVYTIFNQGRQVFFPWFFFYIYFHSVHQVFTTKCWVKCLWRFRTRQLRGLEHVNVLRSIKYAFNVTHIFVPCLCVSSSRTLVCVSYSTKPPLGGIN